MQTVFNLKELDFSFFEKLKKQYFGKEVTITVNEDPSNVNQLEVFKELQALQKKYSPKVISKDIDLSALANEVNL